MDVAGRYQFITFRTHDSLDALKAAALRDAILEGYQDAITGRITIFSGDFWADMRSIQEENNP